jgi:hypothetical protein
LLVDVEGCNSDVEEPGNTDAEELGNSDVEEPGNTDAEECVSSDAEEPGNTDAGELCNTDEDDVELGHTSTPAIKMPELFQLS